MASKKYRFQIPTVSDIFGFFFQDDTTSILVNYHRLLGWWTGSGKWRLPWRSSSQIGSKISSLLIVSFTVLSLNVVYSH